MADDEKDLDTLDRGAWQALLEDALTLRDDMGRLSLVGLKGLRPKGTPVQEKGQTNGRR